MRSKFQQTSTELPTFEAVWIRIKQATGLKRQADLATALGITAPSVSGAKERGLFPLEWAYKLARSHDLSLDYLLLEGRDVGQDEPKIATEISSFLHVPKVNARLQVDSLDFQVCEGVQTTVAFRTAWLRELGDPEQMILMDAHGDAMAPEIQAGDVVLIDQGQREIYIGCMYAIGMDSEVLISYIEKIPGQFLLRYANRQHEPIPVKLGDQGVRVVGRVVWWSRVAK